MIASQALVQIRLFGTARFTSEERPWRFSAPSRALALLAYVVLHHGTQFSRDAAAFALWPEETEERARANLRRHIHLVNGALPRWSGAWIAGGHGMLSWNPDAPAWIDVVEYLRLAGGAEGGVAAAELYGGDLLPELGDDWLSPLREEMREAQTALLLRLCSGARESGAFGDAILYAQRALVIDPWREDAIRALIALRHASGDRAGALHTYVAFAGRLARELGVEPMPETTEAYERIAGEFARARAAATVKGNLPETFTSVYGRAADIERVGTLVRAQRLVTLIGAGGVGKTRLAIETARTIASHFDDGVWFVDCSTTPPGSSIVPALARALGVHEIEATPLLDAVAAAVASGTQLLILDNCEHVTESAATAIVALTAAAPDLHVLVTSRTPLRCAGEAMYRTPSLAMPSDDDSSIESLRRSPAARMFLDRAAVVAPGLTWNTVDRIALLRVCRRLDGIPLAIELAAPRCALLTVTEIADRLEGNLRLVASAGRRRIARQQTLRATLDWSYGLLETDEQRFLQCLAVFVPGCSLDAARAVAACDDEFVALECLASLVEKSLALAEPVAGRYRLLETTRVYARERLEADGAREAVEERHADYFKRDVLRRLEAAYTAGTRTMHVTDLDNALAAMAWFEARGRFVDSAAIAQGLAGWFGRTGRRLEGIAVLRRVLHRLPSGEPRLEAGVRLALARLTTQLAVHDAPEHAARARELFARVGSESEYAAALFAEGDLLTSLGRFGQAEPLLERALALWSKNAHPDAAFTLLPLSAARSERGDHAGALAYLERCVEAAREIGDVWLRGNALAGMGIVERARGDAARAVAYCAEAAAVMSAAGDLLAAASHLTAKIAALIALARYDEALADVRSVLRYASETGYEQGLLTALFYAARIAADRGHPRLAARLVGHVLALRDRRTTVLALDLDAEVEPLRERLAAMMAPGELRTAMHLGELLTTADACAEAVGDAPPVELPAAGAR